MSDNKTSDNDKEDTKIIVKTSKTHAYRPTRNTTKPTTLPIRQNMTKTKKKSSSKILIIAICTIAVLMTLAISTLFYTIKNTTSAPVNVSKQLINDIQSKNSNDAYNLLSPAAQSTISSNDFTQVVNRIGPILNGTPKLQSKEVSAKKEDGQTAKVVYQIIGSDNLTYNLTITLVKSNGTWQVQNFDSKQQQ